MLIELLGAGRVGHTPLGRLHLSFADLLAMGRAADLVAAPLRVRSPRGTVLAEVSVSVALIHAVRALEHAAPNLLRRGVGGATGPAEVSGAGAAIAIGASEATLRLRSSHLARAGLLPTNVWVEVDLRRSCGQLLRSAAKPAGAQRVSFDMRELLYIADGSAQQRRLAAG